MCDSVAIFLSYIIFLFSFWIITDLLSVYTSNLWRGYFIKNENLADLFRYINCFLLIYLHRGILKLIHPYQLKIGVPFLITLPTSFWGRADFINNFTCWINYGSNIAIGTMVPILATAIATIIIMESTFMGYYPLLPLTRKIQMGIAQ